MAKKLQMDWLLFSVTAALAIFGVVMVYSASAMISLRETRGETGFFYFYKQLIFVAVGFLLMWVGAKTDYHIFQKKLVVYVLLIITIMLLAVVYAFSPVNGARRWIRFSGFSFQPSELSKLALSIFLAWYFTEKSPERIKDVLSCLPVVAILLGLVLFEPDFGTTLILTGIFIVVYFSAGAKITHLLLFALPLIVALTAFLWFSPLRMQRVMSFLEPCSEENSQGIGYQVCQSLYAIGSGGVFGEGFAKSQQKLFYLPYPYSDFIFAVIGEELGLIGTMTIVIAFAIFLWCGTRAAVGAPDRFGMLLGIGIVTGILIQALFNLSVVLSLLPAKGVTLPFLSYGGSSMVVTLFSVGILLNLSKHVGIHSIQYVNEKPFSVRRKRLRN
ncbi:MAG: putative lipid II flippase FtsW [Pyrinomonadaceae bacterium]|nr:putative lipid II flippase FtsW [Pyrinomonadaceae bacterium]